MLGLTIMMHKKVIYATQDKKKIYNYEAKCKSAEKLRNLSVSSGPKMRTKQSMVLKSFFF